MVGKREEYYDGHSFYLVIWDSYFYHNVLMFLMGYLYIFFSATNRSCVGHLPWQFCDSYYYYELRKFYPWMFCIFSLAHLWHSFGQPGVFLHYLAIPKLLYTISLIIHVLVHCLSVRGFLIYYSVDREFMLGLVNPTASQCL